MFVAVGADGSILASPDLVRWGEFDAGMTNNLRAVVYGQGLFVTVGDSGVILTSFDGQAWEAPRNETPTLTIFTPLERRHGFSSRRGSRHTRQLGRWL
jgi:hypothetical protein